MMKKVTLIFAFVAFVSYIGLSQTLTWRFANFEVVNAGTQLQFDVQVKGDGSTTYHRDLQVYFDYNTAGFGTDWVAGGHVTVNPLPLMDNYYSFVNTVDNTSSKIAIITEADNEMSQVGGAGGFNLMQGTFTGLFQVVMDITDNTATAGIAFDEALMNGGQYYQSETAIEPVKYTDPCVYDNDLLTNKLSTAYGNITYANTASTPLTDITVKLMNGAVEVGSGLTDAAGNYYISGIDDGTYSLENSTTKAWGGLTNFDVIFTKRWIQGLMTFSDLQRMAGDVTESGDPSNLDVIMMKRKIQGLSTPAWTAPDYVFLSASVTVSGGIGNKDYQSLCSGDVNKSYIPPAN